MSKELNGGAPGTARASPVSCGATQAASDADAVCKAPAAAPHSDSRRFTFRKSKKPSTRGG